MLTAFRALPLLWRLASILGLVLALSGSVWGLYAYVKHQGYVEGFEVSRAKCEAEKKAQEAANVEAIRLALEKLSKDVQGIAEQTKGIDEAVGAIDEAVKADPNAGEECLSREAAARLNRIR